MTKRLVALIALSGLASACAPPEVGVMAFPPGEVQHVVRAANTPWKPCPPTLPAGCEMAVLEGNPKGEDLFTVRFRVATGTFVMPPHWHPKPEN